MPIYIIKRYHRVLPGDESVWHLGYEAAFHATSDAKAIAFAQKQDGQEFKQRGGLAILLDPRGRRLWETVFDRPSVSSAAQGSELAPTAGVNSTLS